MRSREPRPLHPVYLMMTVGVMVGLTALAFGVPTLFARPAAAFAALLTLGVYFLRSVRSAAPSRIHDCTRGASRRSHRR